MPGLGARLAVTMERGHLPPRGRQACVARSSAAISSAVNANESAPSNGSHTLWSAPVKRNTEMGPLIDSAAVARVDRIVEDSASYAKAIVRGGPVGDGPLAAGAFYRPSLIEVEDLDAPIIQQEIFGPVATFEVFDDENDAIHRANATEFGLAAAVFTRDVDRARRVSRQINAGTVWTNTWFAIDNGFEEGGYKQSGLGRLRGARGLADFQEIKTYVHFVPPVAD
jgi:betaine-aldehyde dehydrogenase